VYFWRQKTEFIFFKLSKKYFLIVIIYVWEFSYFYHRNRYLYDNKYIWIYGLLYIWLNSIVSSEKLNDWACVCTIMINVILKIAILLFLLNNKYIIQSHTWYIYVLNNIFLIVICNNSRYFNNLSLTFRLTKNNLLNVSKTFNCRCLFGIPTSAFARIVVTSNKAGFRSRSVTRRWEIQSSTRTDFTNNSPF